MAEGQGFIAALDQSGGSTPKALAEYGIAEDSYSGETEMFDLIHAMRTRIINSPGFDGSKVIGAILFEQTMDRSIDGVDSAEFLWSRKHVVPFLKVDKGLMAEADGVQLMKPIDGLDELLERAGKTVVFGTKMRSVIQHADADGIEAIVAQQFEYAARISAAGFMPIIEPEININCPEKASAEAMLKTSIEAHLGSLAAGEQVMLKLTLPSEAGFYSGFVADARVLRVVALSGGYSRDQACELLAKNAGVIASFSRALSEGLSADQSDEAFNAMLQGAIDEIYQASVAHA
jgi:fructose-bisphosphate aldolase class I